MSEPRPNHELLGRFLGSTPAKCPGCKRVIASARDGECPECGEVLALRIISLREIRGAGMIPVIVAESLAVGGTLWLLLIAGAMWAGELLVVRGLGRGVGWRLWGLSIAAVVGVGITGAVIMNRRSLTRARLRSRIGALITVAVAMAACMLVVWLSMKVER